MASTEREHFSKGIGFTLAAVGSAVGLGNMWRFSYMAAENGGAAFVVLYVVMTALVGLPVMLAELTLGRGAQKSPIQALVHYGGARWAPLGALFVVTGAIILAYYSVIAGWTIRYTVEAIIGGFPQDAGTRFGEIASGVPALLWHLGFMAATIVVVSGGVKAGIERAALVLMPLLAVLIVGIAAYAATLEGSSAGYAYYFQTDLAAIWNYDVLSDAAGQAFFSLSLGMGAILTYASYLDRDHDLPKESVMIAVSDFGVAFVAGLVVFPLIFALGLESIVGDVKESTLGALFVALPTAFVSMGGVGTIVGVLFFSALVVGALTSAMSLLEVVVASVIDRFGIGRRRAAILCGVVIAMIGAPAALDLTVLDLMDQIGGAILLVFGGLLLSILVGWVLPDAESEALEGSSRTGLGPWRLLLRYVVPVLLVFVLVGLVSKTVGNIAKILEG